MGHNKNRIFDEMEYETTGNPAVDACLACISYHRSHGVKVTAIKLRDDYFEMFKAFVDARMENDADNYSIDGVDIDRSDMEIAQTMVVITE